MEILTVLLIAFTIHTTMGSKPVYTQVMCMYDIKRGDLDIYKRTFSQYLNNFSKMLESDANLIIFGGKEIRDFVWQRRKKRNTIFIQREIDEFKKYWFATYAEKVRKGYLADPLFSYKEHPQYALEHYNLIMFAKLYLMIEAQKYDKWNTDFLVWTDGGLMHIFPQNLVSPQNVIQKFYQLVQPQWILFTYFQQNTVFKKGFQRSEFKYLGRNTKYYEAVLAGHQGGYIEIVKDIKNAFQNLLRITLEYNDMNSDETVMAMVPICYPFLIPNTVNIYLNDFVNKFNIYEDIKRFSPHPRFFEGRFDSKGRITVRKNQTLTKYTKSPKAGGAFNSNGSVIMHSLKQMEEDRQKYLIQMSLTPKFIVALQRRLSVLKKADIKKIIQFVFLSLLLLILLRMNKKIKNKLEGHKAYISVAIQSMD